MNFSYANMEDIRILYGIQLQTDPFSESAVAVIITNFAVTAVYSLKELS